MLTLMAQHKDITRTQSFQNSRDSVHGRHCIPGCLHGPPTGFSLLNAVRGHWNKCPRLLNARVHYVNRVHYPNCPSVPKRCKFSCSACHKDQSFLVEKALALNCLAWLRQIGTVQLLEHVCVVLLLVTVCSNCVLQGSLITVS